MPVVMINEHGEDALEVTRIENQQPIEALGTNGSHESFRDPVRLRRQNRRAHDTNAPALKHLIETPREFPIVIAEQETNWFRALGERPRHLTCMLRHSAVVGMGGAAGEVHVAGRHLDEEQHVQPPQPDRVDGEEIYGNDTPRLRTQELMPRWPLAPTRWTEMFLAKDLPHRVADTTTPSPFSSPTMR